jgi:hypothetical protein
MNNPMNLKDLPEYIKSLQESGSSGDMVVDIGRIVAPRSNLFRNLAFAGAFLLLSAVVAYNLASKDLTIATDMSPQALAVIVSENGGRVVSISENEDKTYRVRVLSFGSFIEKLRKNKNIQIK